MTELIKYVALLAQLALPTEQRTREALRYDHGRFRALRCMRPTQHTAAGLDTQQTQCKDSSRDVYIKIPWCRFPSCGRGKSSTWTRTWMGVYILIYVRIMTAAVDDKLDYGKETLLRGL